MSLISDMREHFSSSYTKLFGIEELGLLITKIHSTLISSGTELERIITSSVKKKQLVQDLDKFINSTYTNKINNGTYLVTKKVLKNSKLFEGKINVDFLIFDITNEYKKCHIIELKSHSTLDTKKSYAEKLNLIQFHYMFSKKIDFNTNIFLCTFYEEDKQSIYNNLKKNFDIGELLTGKELTSLLGINYNSLIKIINKNQSDNLDFVYKHFLKIFINMFGKDKLISDINNF